MEELNDVHDDGSFMFTSESVGEGHPGDFKSWTFKWNSQKCAFKLLYSKTIFYCLLIQKLCTCMEGEKDMHYRLIIHLPPQVNGAYFVDRRNGKLVKQQFSRVHSHI